MHGNIQDSDRHQRMAKTMTNALKGKTHSIQFTASQLCKTKLFFQIFNPLILLSLQADQDKNKKSVSQNICFTFRLLISIIRHLLNCFDNVFLQSIPSTCSTFHSINTTDHSQSLQNYLFCNIKIQAKCLHELVFSTATYYYRSGSRSEKLCV